MLGRAIQVFSVKKIDSNDCFKGLKDHKNFPKGWEDLKKYGFCAVPKKNEVIRRRIYNKNLVFVCCEACCVKDF